MKDALGHGSNPRGSHSTGVEQVTSSPSTLNHGFVQDKFGTWRDAEGNASGFFSTATKGRGMVHYGPHPSREAAAAEAFANHPKAKSVSTSYRRPGSDMQWHNR